MGPGMSVGGGRGEVERRERGKRGGRKGRERGRIGLCVDGTWPHLSELES